jgi:hypothetical protein
VSVALASGWHGAAAMDLSLEMEERSMMFDGMMATDGAHMGM